MIVFHENFETTYIIIIIISPTVVFATFDYFMLFLYICVLLLLNILLYKIDKHDVLTTSKLLLTFNNLQ